MLHAITLLSSVSRPENHQLRLAEREREWHFLVLCVIALAICGLDDLRVVVVF